MGYLLEALWSADGRYVAVNNRRGNSGDYLWVFSVPDGRVLQAPNDELGLVFADRACRRFPDLSLDGFNTFYNIAIGWKEGDELQVQATLQFNTLRHAIVLRRAIYEPKRDRLTLRSEDFEKVTSPRKEGSRESSLEHFDR
jgi:hypothetical protein